MKNLLIFVLLLVLGAVIYSNHTDVNDRSYVSHQSSTPTEIRKYSLSSTQQVDRSAFNTILAQNYQGFTGRQVLYWRTAHDKASPPPMDRPALIFENWIREGARKMQSAGVSQFKSAEELGTLSY